MVMIRSCWDVRCLVGAGMMKRCLARAITLIFTADWTLGSIESMLAGTIKNRFQDVQPHTAIISQYFIVYFLLVTFSVCSHFPS